MVTACQHAIVLPYAAYLRVYEPLSAFSGADGQWWAAYAASAGRPRRTGALAAEHADALRRLLADPPVVAPGWESGDAYVRWAEGVTYICPWQTQLRSWLGLAKLKTTSPPLWSAAFPPGVADSAVNDFARGHSQASSLRVHIQGSTWSVPPAWFVPFAPDERWLVLGAASDPGESGRATAAATRTLVYATAMAQARRRVALGAAGAPRAGSGTPPARSAAISSRIRAGVTASWFMRSICTAGAKSQTPQRASALMARQSWRCLTDSTTVKISLTTVVKYRYA